MTNAAQIATQTMVYLVVNVAGIVKPLPAVLTVYQSAAFGF